MVKRPELGFSYLVYILLDVRVNVLAACRCEEQQRPQCKRRRAGSAAVAAVSTNAPHTS